MTTRQVEMISQSRDKSCLPYLCTLQNYCFRKKSFSSHTRFFSVRIQTYTYIGVAYHWIFFICTKLFRNLQVHLQQNPFEQSTYWELHATKQKYLNICIWLYKCYCHMQLGLPFLATSFLSVVMILNCICGHETRIFFCSPKIRVDTHNRVNKTGFHFAKYIFILIA